MKKTYLLLLFVLCACHGIQVPDSFTYKEIQTDSYKLASWQKITNNTTPVRIYLEGDGYSFNHMGQPTTNPTPRGTFLRKIAFNDPNPNVVYLARPCQFVNDDTCSVKDWTTGRFSQKIVDSVTQALKDISNKQEIILIGYSGGALLSGLIINQNPQIPVIKWITLAGVLNHTKWTEDLNLSPLKDSIDLEKLPTIPQLHLIGDKDTTVSYKLTESLVDKDSLMIIPKAKHDSGYEDYYQTIYFSNIFNELILFRKTGEKICS